MTVIHADFEDTDTRVLKALWKGIDADVYSVGRGALGHRRGSEQRDDLKRAISSEKDTILFCGHGSSGGLWEPGGMYLFDEGDIPLVKAKNVIGIWCHAREFAITTGLRGFYSSMFISNSMEARCNGIYGVSDSEITKSEIRFCDRINELLKNNVPLEDWLEILRSYPITNDVEEFNYKGLFYQS